MTEERIGGISVEIEGSLGKLEAALAKAEQMVKESAERMSATGQVTLGASVKTSGGGRAGGGAGSEQLTSAINALTEQLQQTRFSGGRGGRDPYALSIKGGSGQRLNIDIGDLSKDMQAEVSKAIGGISAEISKPTARPASVRANEVNVTSSQPINLDLSAFNKQVEAATASLAELAAAISRTPAAASPGGGGQPRRASASEIDADERRRVAIRRSAAKTAKSGDDEAATIQMIEPRPLSSQRMRAVWSSTRAPRVIPPPSPEYQGQTYTGPLSPTSTYSFHPEDESVAEAQAAASRDRLVASRARSIENPNKIVIRSVAGQLSRRMPITKADNPIPEAVPTPEPAGSGYYVGRERTVDEIAAEQARVAARLRKAPLTPEQQVMADIQREREARRTPPPKPLNFRDQTSRAALEAGGTGSRYRPKTDEEIEREVSNRIAVREGQLVSAGRTPRTGAAGLGGFFLGGGRQRIADENALTAATQKRRIAERELIIAEDRLNDPKIQRNLRLKKAATDDLTFAQEDLSKAIGEEDRARKKVASYSGLASGLRNLAGATIGGAAFGLGLEAVNEVTKAIEAGLAPAINRAIDANSNFSASNTKVTASLSEQSTAMQGNTKGAILSAAAISNVSSAQADYLTAALTPETLAKTGTTALAQGASLFKAAAGAGQGAAAQGLIGGYGGVLGTPLFGSQMGGGQGFMETLAQNLQDFATSAAKAAPGTIEKSYTENTPSGQYQISQGPTSRDITEADNARAARDAYIASLTEATTRGAGLTGQSTKLSIQALKPGESGKAFVDAAGQVSTQAAGFAKTMADSGYVLKDAFGNIASSGKDLVSAFTNMAAGLSTPDLSTVTQQAQVMSTYNEKIRQAVDIGSRQAAFQQVQFQQEKSRPAFMGQLTRTSADVLNRQNPVSAYLENLANPPIAPGAGISLSKRDSAATQARVNAGIKEAQGLQSTLDAYYEQGRQQIEQTYKPAILATFGQAGAQVFDGLLNKAAAVSQQIQTIETGVTQEQAAYATHQYENDLRIAKRSLTDILQLTGQIGAAGGDNLGVYERQNLLLGRQAQQLQFMLSQRQINFQTAIAGFQVPGLTPAEQNARVEEAKIEASYAQKQLDIQKKMFGNQVKVVDISNLRQATDLMHQIGLLQEGRKVTLDTAAAQARLVRLQKIQSALQKDISVYTSAVDTLSQKAISDIAEQEQAVGHAISNIETQAVKAAYNVGHALFLGISGGFLGSGVVSGGASGTSKNDKGKNAAGALFSTTGSTSMIVGEAGTETVAVLRNPRSAEPGGFGGGWGGDIVINLTATLDGQVIYKDVVRRQGRDAALRGLRGIN